MVEKFFCISCCPNWVNYFFFKRKNWIILGISQWTGHQSRISSNLWRAVSSRRSKWGRLPKFSNSYIYSCRNYDNTTKFLNCLWGQDNSTVKSKNISSSPVWYTLLNSWCLTNLIELIWSKLPTFFFKTFHQLERKAKVGFIRTDGDSNWYLHGNK